MNKLNQYEVTAAGFDGETDMTDNRVFWIAAPSADMVKAAIVNTGATYCGCTGYDVSDCTDYTLPQDIAAMQTKLKEFK